MRRFEGELWMNYLWGPQEELGCMLTLVSEVRGTFTETSIQWKEGDSWRKLGHQVCKNASPKKLVFVWTTNRLFSRKSGLCMVTSTVFNDIHQWQRRYSSAVSVWWQYESSRHSLWPPCRDAIIRSFFTPTPICRCIESWFGKSFENFWKVILD